MPRKKTAPGQVSIFGAADLQVGRLAINWTPEQEDIFFHVEHADHNLVIGACAGSGKTTTLLEIRNRLHPETDVLVLAFSREIKQTIEKRLPPGTRCHTIHGYGLRALMAYKQGQCIIQDDKLERIVQPLVGKLPWLPAEFGNDMAEIVARTARFARLTLTNLGNTKSADWMMDHFAIVDNIEGLVAGIIDYVVHNPDAPRQGCSILFVREHVVALASAAVEESIQQFKAESIVDFDEMIYLPCRLGMKVRRAEVVLVDEAQDLSAAQRWIVMNAARNGGRVIAVGDEDQAIYGFAGADCYSFERIIKDLDATVLPLTTCYRCPESHITAVHRYVENIHPRPNAPYGSIHEIEFPDIHRYAQPGDMVLSRSNAPLIGVALQMIVNNIPVMIRGRDIAGGLVKLVQEATHLIRYDEGFTDGFTRGLHEVVSHRRRLLRDEVLLQNLFDQQKCLEYLLFHRPDIHDGAGLIEAIKELFSDGAGKGKVVACSMHRAKGLESENVFILNPDKVVFHEDQRGWMRQQELNLQYVAQTRAKQRLFRVAVGEEL